MAKAAADFDLCLAQWQTDQKMKERSNARRPKAQFWELLFVTGVGAGVILQACLWGIYLINRS
jgi:hypothetical protein